MDPIPYATVKPKGKRPPKQPKIGRYLKAPIREGDDLQVAAYYCTECDRGYTSKQAYKKHQINK